MGDLSLHSRSNSPFSRSSSAGPLKTSWGCETSTCTSLESSSAPLFLFVPAPADVMGWAVARQMISLLELPEWVGVPTDRVGFFGIREVCDQNIELTKFAFSNILDVSYATLPPSIVCQQV